MPSNLMLHAQQRRAALMPLVLEAFEVTRLRSLIAITARFCTLHVLTVVCSRCAHRMRSCFTISSNEHAQTLLDAALDHP